MPQAGVSTHSGDGETSCCLSPMIDFARKVCPQPFVERRECWMHARMDRIAWPRNRDRVLLGNVRARPLRQQVDFVGKTERLFEIVGDQENADLLALDHATTSLTTRARTIA